MKCECKVKRLLKTSDGRIVVFCPVHGENGTIELNRVEETARQRNERIANESQKQCPECSSRMFLLYRRMMNAVSLMSNMRAAKVAAKWGMWAGVNGLYR